VASLYRELGFDPGGDWVPTWNGGYEAADVVGINQEICEDLGLTLYSPRLEVPAPARRLARQLVPGTARLAVRRVLLRRRRPNLLPWDRFDEVVETYRSRIVAAASHHSVVKDPLFCWTLNVWAAAGADISHVLVCARRFDSVVQSWKATGFLEFSDEAAKNSFAYGLGLCMTAAVDYGLPYAVMRFPEDLERPDQLFAAMSFPTHVSREQFMDAFARIAKTDWVHH
jgi:hypothetical protein